MSDKISSLSKEHPLVEAVRRGNAALFLGAGASDGAMDANNKRMPFGKQLAKILAERFLSKRYVEAEFRVVYDIRFEEIVLNEYEEITPRRAQQLYLDVCSLHRFGSPARAGLISRVHGLRFEDFQKEFFKPLEEVVLVELDTTVNDHVYKSRHSYIADLIFRSKVVSIEEKFENLSRIVTKLNPNFSYDVSVVEKLMHHSNLMDVQFPRALGKKLYETALESFGASAFLYHQEAIFLMQSANTFGQLDDADAALASAQELDQAATSIKHTAAEIALKRARLASSADEAQAWRSRAVELAQPLARVTRTPHAHHTIAKARLDSLAHVLKDFEGMPNAPGVQELLEQEVKESEAALRSGLEAFPGDPHLLTAQAEWHKLLSHSDKAEIALARAFVGNPRSTVVARRLASVYAARKDYVSANRVLIECLDHNVGNHDLHFLLALNLMAENDDYADEPRRAVIRNHLSRSFQKGDKLFSRRLWYARELFLEKSAEARQYFNEMRNSFVSYQVKKRIFGKLVDGRQYPARFSGVVDEARSAYCYIYCDQFAMRIYYGLNEVNTFIPDKGIHVTFEIAFNMFSPIAENLEAQ